MHQFIISDGGIDPVFSFKLSKLTKPKVLYRVAFQVAYSARFQKKTELSKLKTDDTSKNISSK